MYLIKTHFFFLYHMFLFTLSSRCLVVASSCSRSLSLQCKNNKTENMNKMSFHRTFSSNVNPPDFSTTIDDFPQSCHHMQTTGMCAAALCPLLIKPCPHDCSDISLGAKLPPNLLTRSPKASTMEYSSQ